MLLQGEWRPRWESGDLRPHLKQPYDGPHSRTRIRRPHEAQEKELANQEALLVLGTRHAPQASGLWQMLPCPQKLLPAP